MGVIYQQLDSLALEHVSITLMLALPFLHELMVELDQEKHLVLHVREKIVFPDQLEDIWPPQTEVIGQRLPWLSVGSVPIHEQKISYYLTIIV